MHCVAWALCLAFASAGNSIAAKIAMMAITTNSSIKVKPVFPREELDDEQLEELVCL
jgi:hypothetical protein